MQGVAFTLGDVQFADKFLHNALGKKAMELELAKRIVETINQFSNHEAELIEDYSGRGMNGKGTAAVLTDCCEMEFGFYYCTAEHDTWGNPDYNTECTYDGSEALQNLMQVQDDLLAFRKVYY